MASPSTPEPITVLPLPLLPHPTSLSAGSPFLITEAKRNLDELTTFRQSIISQSSTYLLDPPGPSSLPPLPGIPQPPQTHVRRSSTLGVSSQSYTPLARPPIPPTSPFHGLQSVTECCSEFRKLGHHVEERYDRTALWVVIGTSLASWILLREHEEGLPPGVRSLRLYDDNVQAKPIHAHSSSAPLRGMAKHLSELSLSLPELLARLISLPELLKQPCHYCQKHLKVPEGLPYAKTGYLPSPGGEGRWVDWHPSCEPTS